MLERHLRVLRAQSGPDRTVPESTGGVFAERGGRDSPRRATSFLVRDKKGGKEARPTVATPSRCEGANLRRGACGVRRGTHCALRASFGQPRRVRSRSGCVLRHTRHPASIPPQAQRWHVGCSFPGFPSGCAEERSGQRIRARDCLSATQWSEFERDPAGREHRRLPGAKRRDAACRVALSLVTFFRRSERKLLACRATPGLRPLQRHASNY